MGVSNAIVSTKKSLRGRTCWQCDLRAPFSITSQTLKNPKAITTPSMATESSSSTRREPKQIKQTSQTPLPTEDSHLLPNLPFEIIVEILLRLPVKSLLRFRCVSKSWRSLISQRKFAKTHLSLASMNTNYTHHRLILKGWYSFADFKSCSLHSILNEKPDTAVELDCPMKGSYSPVHIVGCCDGLLCISIHWEVFIWNPSTRKSKRLPNVVTPSNNFRSCGFGYDGSVDDYKVVGLWCHICIGDFEVEVEVIQVKVYSLRTDSWRTIGGFPHFLAIEPLGTYSNGALHWTCHRESNDVIVSLDLANETYGEVLEPDYRDGDLFSRLLYVLNGCLCILRAYGDCFHVWVMKEYGIRESWTKLVVIPYGAYPNPMSDPCPKPLCLLKNGEVLVNFYKHVVRYNPKDNTFIYPTIRNYSSCFNAHCYIESLVSPKFDSGVQWQHQY